MGRWWFWIQLLLWCTQKAPLAMASFTPTASSCNLNQTRCSDCGEASFLLFLRHVITAVGWKSVVLVTDTSTNTDAVELLQTEGTSMISVTLQWPAVNGGAQWNLYQAIAARKSYSANVVTLGHAEFTQQVISQVVGMNNSAPSVFNWLTMIPRGSATSLLEAVGQIDNLALVVRDAFCGVTLETLLHEGSVHRLSQVTRWSPCEPVLPRLTETLVFPNVNCGLCGLRLKMATLPWSPFMIQHKNATSIWYTGLCMDILEILTENLNFTYTITQPKDGNWGQVLPNDTWIGLTGMLHKKEVDFALAAMSITSARATVSDYTIGFFYDEVVMMTIYPNPVDASWTFFMRPFHWLVYVLLGCCLIITTLLLAFIERCNVSAQFSHLGGYIWGNTPLILSSIAHAGETLFGTMLGRAVAYTGASLSSRVLLMAWLFFSIVTLATYTGKLTSNSLVIRQPLPFRSLSDLVKRTDYRWGFNRKTMLEDIFKNSKNPDYQKFYKKLLEFETADPNVTAEDTETILQTFESQNTVRLTAMSYYQTLKTKHCKLTVVPDRVYQDTLAIYLQKGSPYTAMFDKILSKMADTGVLGYLISKWFPESSTCQGEDTRVMSVSLELMPTAFFLAFLGLMLATLVLGLERLSSDNQCQPQPDRLAPLCMPACWM